MFFAGIIFFECLLILFFSLLHFFFFGKKKSNLFALFFFLFSLHGFYYALFYSGLLKVFPEILGFGLIFPFLHNPILYFLIKKIQNHDYEVEKKDLLHFVPALLWLGYFLPIFLLPKQVKIELIEKSMQMENPLEIPGYSTFPLIAVYMFFYFGIYVYRFYLMYRSIVKANTTGAEKYKKPFLSYLLWSVVLFLLFLFLFAGHLVHLDILFKVNLAGIGFLSIIFMIMYNFFPLWMKTGPIASVLPYSFKSEEKEILRALDIPFIQQQIESLMKEKKIFQKERISLKDLAAEIGLSVHELSAFLNCIYKDRFQNFVNRYRIEFAKDLLENSKDDTIITIAYESGFSSLSAFQTAFKKNTGMSPGQYRDNT